MSPTCSKCGAPLKHTYTLTIKGGAQFHLASDGTILWDGERNMGPFSDWRVFGFSTRLNANRVVPLAQAAAGESIGQGWIHDLDHGTHRLWCMPRHHRAVSLVRCPT
jgi:hypothetical protein